MPRRSPEEWRAIEAILRLRNVSWSYFECKNRRMSIWTTAPLYPKGPFEAILAEADGTTVFRESFRRRKDAKKQAELWLVTHHGGHTHSIEEMP